MEQIEKEGERLDKILFETKLLIEQSDIIHVNINHFSSVTFGLPHYGNKDTEKIFPECVVSDIISNLNLLKNYLESIGMIVNGLNAELRKAKLDSNICT